MKTGYGWPGRVEPIMETVKRQLSKLWVLEREGLAKVT